MSKHLQSVKFKHYTSIVLSAIFRRMVALVRALSQRAPAIQESSTLLGCQEAACRYI